MKIRPDLRPIERRDDGQQEMVQLDFQFKRKSRAPLIQEQSRCEFEHSRQQELRKEFNCNVCLHRSYLLNLA